MRCVSAACRALVCRRPDPSAGRGADQLQIEDAPSGDVEGEEFEARMRE